MAFSGVSSLLFYPADGVQVSAIVGMAAGDTISSGILDEKTRAANSSGFFSGTFPAIVGGEITNISLSGKPGDGLDNTISGNCVYVYDSTLDRIVAHLAPFIASTGGGGPFSNPNVITTNATVSRVDLTANLSGGPGKNASFDGNLDVSGGLGISGNTDILGNLFVSGNTVLSGTLLVSGSTAIGQDPQDPDFIVNDPAGAVVRIDTYNYGGAGQNNDSEINFRENSVDRGTLKWDGGDNDFVWNSTAGDIRINPNGSVGINEDAPSEKLHVGGNAKVDGTLVVSSQNSVAGQDSSLPTVATLVSPTPPGAFCFLSAVGDGTAGTSEISFGEGTTVQGVSSVGNRNVSENAGYYYWEDANALEVSANGIYKVDFAGIVGVAAAIDVTVTFYTCSTIVKRFDLRIHSVTDPHTIVGSWVGLVTTSTPISVTINSGSGDNAQLLQSSTLFVQRLA